MATDNSAIGNNTLAFIALSNEYCNTLASAAELERNEFISIMIKLLPRLYIMATDLQPNSLMDQDEAYLANILDEDYYESIRRNIEKITGEDDIYLEVFEEDMKYSDTPVSASIAEGLADIFQPLYNFIETIRNATDEVISLAVSAVKDEFKTYWSATLCNTLRALNRIAMSI